MKILLVIEELAMAVLCGWGLYQFQAPWWCYLLLFIGPDIGMLGYLISNKTGAAVYNLFHHKGLAVALFLTGICSWNVVITIAGLILFGHASLDRMLGYGLKLNKGFNYTHLGIIGKEKYEERKESDGRNI